MSKKEVIQFIESRTREKLVDSERNEEIYCAVLESRKLLAEACSQGPRSEAGKALLRQAVKKIHYIYMSFNIGYDTLGVLLGRSAGWFSINFSDLGLARKSNLARIPNHPTKYFIDEHAFNKWNSKSAYWIGFIWADGYVHNSLYRKYLRVVVQESDAQHLFNLRNFLKSDIPVNTVFYRSKKGGESYPQSEITINRKIVVESLLLKKVLVNRSTDNVEFPDVPKEFFWDFIRGYFDGDGAIFRPQKCNFSLSGWAVSFAGSETVLQSLKTEIRRCVGIEMDFRRNGTSETNFSLTRTGPEIFKILRVLYPDDAAIGLARKKGLARTLLKAFDFALEKGVSVNCRGDGYRFMIPQRFEFPTELLIND